MTIEARQLRARLGKGVAAAAAMVLMVGACSGDDDGGSGGQGEEEVGQGGGDGDPTRPSLPSLEETQAGNLSNWDTCEVLGDDLQELVEFLDAGLEDDLTDLNGEASLGVKLCHGVVLWIDDPESNGGDVYGDIDFGFGTASQEGETLAPEEYQTPTGRYDQALQLRRELYSGDELIEDTEITGSWDSGAFVMGDGGTGISLTALLLNTESDFMVELSVNLDSAEQHERHPELTWTVEEAQQHFLEVTVPNAYQAMIDRMEAAVD